MDGEVPGPNTFVVAPADAWTSSWHRAAVTTLAAQIDPQHRARGDSAARTDSDASRRPHRRHEDADFLVLAAGFVLSPAVRRRVGGISERPRGGQVATVGATPDRHDETS